MLLPTHTPPPATPTPLPTPQGGFDSRIGPLPAPFIPTPLVTFRIEGADDLNRDLFDEAMAMRASSPGLTISNVTIGEDPNIGVEPVAYVTTLRAMPRFTIVCG